MKHRVSSGLGVNCDPETIDQLAFPGNQREAVDQARWGCRDSPSERTAALNVSSSMGSGRMTDRKPSTIAFAADVADEAPRALTTALPRLATVGINVSSNHALSLIAAVAGLPLIRAFL